VSAPTDAENNKAKSQSIIVETIAPDKKDEGKKAKDKKKSDDKKVERFVMPFTRWVEGKLQKSSVINPTAKQAKKSQSKASQHTLRTAIKQALSLHPGTVLSADKVQQNNGLVFKIKILSKDGVIRIVTVPSMDKKEN